MAEQDPKPSPQAVKKKKKEKKKAEHIKAVKFVDWTNPTVSESTEERETEMFGLVVRFSMRMLKRAANTQGETSSGLEVPGEKRSKRFGLDEEVQAVWA